MYRKSLKIFLLSECKILLKQKKNDTNVSLKKLYTAIKTRLLSTRCHYIPTVVFPTRKI